MAEAFALVGTIITLVQLTGKVTSLSYNYVGVSKRARKDLRDLVDELTSLGKVLDTLQDYVDAANPMQSKAILQLDGGPLQACARELRELQAKLEPEKGWKGVVDSLKWPFQEGETMQRILRIERHKTLFTFALTADHMSLSKEILMYAEHTNDIVHKIEGYTENTYHAVKDLQNQSMALERKFGVYAQDTKLGVEDLKTQSKSMITENRAYFDYSKPILEDLRNESTAQEARRQQEEARQRDEKRKEVLQWLSPEDFGTKHIEICGKREENTGKWLPETPDFKDWEEGIGSRLLWGYGIPGAGKTFLSSIVISHLQPVANCAVAYIYFDFHEQDQQKPVQILASLVKQLAYQISSLPKELEDLHKRLNPQDKKPTAEELYSTLLSTFKPFSQVFLVFDALDECDQGAQREKLLPLFHRMGKDGANLFLTSRQYPEDIQESFHSTRKIELLAKDEDIKLYVQNKINANPRAKRLIKQSGSEDRVISNFVDCAKGMFLVVRFHVEYLCQQTTAKQILAALEKLQTASSEKRSLDPTYDRAMEAICGQSDSSVKLAFKILSWLTKARRTLTGDEIQVAVSVEPGKYELDKLDLPDRMTLIDVCAGLVMVDENTNTIRLAHYTVQEYLQRNRIPGDADFNVAIACTTYLSFDIFSMPCASHNLALERFRSYPLFCYAVNNLESHLQSCDEILSMDMVLRLLNTPGSLGSFLQARDSFKAPWRFPTTKYHPPLYVACELGHSRVAKRLLEDGADPLCTDFRAESVLMVAIQREHEGIVRLLLENGADPLITSWERESALIVAIEAKYEGIIRLLLENGADPLTTSREGEPALMVAVEVKHEGIVQLLLENGADPMAIDLRGESALMVAIEVRHEGIVQLLLENGADPLAMGLKGESALMVAIEAKHEGIVRLLLENGADPLFTDFWGESALMVAIQTKHEGIVRLLLENGANPLCKDWLGESTLMKAKRLRLEGVAKLLLDHVRF